MAIKIIDKGESGPDGVITRYSCDYVTDVAQLPTGQDNLPFYEQRNHPAPGSTAIVDESKELYHLPPSRVWSALLVFPQ